MKKQLLAMTCALGFTAAAASAGSPVMEASKNPVTPCAAAPCYAAGELVIKPFYDITLVDSDKNNHYHGEDEFYGGGVAVDYFFTETLGIGVDGYWLDAGSVVHSYNVNLTARTSVISDCLSVYAIGGGGVFTNGSTFGSAHVGGGLEYRLCETFGLFADARYKWLDGGDITLTSIRIGASFVF